MELKLVFIDYFFNFCCILIVPDGIETHKKRNLSIYKNFILIVPDGIETWK